MRAFPECRNSARTSRSVAGPRLLLAALGPFLLLQVSCEARWGFSAGPDGTSEVLFAELGSGQATFFDADGSGGLLPIQRHTSWWTGWDAIVAGDFGGANWDDLLFVDFDYGVGGFYHTDGAGNLSQLRYYDNFYLGWDTVVAGDFDGESGDEVLFIDFQASSSSFSGFAAVYRVDDHGGMTELHHADNWFTGWDAVVAGEFVDSGSLAMDDVVLADFDEGYLAVLNNTGTAFSQVFFTDDVGSGWDQLLAGNFNGDGWTDVLLVNLDQGIAAFYVSDAAGQLTLLLRQENWWTAWDLVATGDFGGDAHTDLMLLDRDGNNLGVYTTDGTGHQTQLVFDSSFDVDADLIVSSPPRGAAEFGYPDPKLFVGENFETTFSGGPWEGEIPLLVIMLGNEKGDNSGPDPPHTQTAAEYHRQFFGPDGVNLADYFWEVSDKKLTIVPAGAGIVGPLPRPTEAEVPAGTNYAERYRTWSLNAAAADGFDFTDLDSSEDGKVEVEELFVIISTAIGPGEGGGGTVRGTIPACFNPGGQSVQLCLGGGDVGAFAHNVSFQLMIHEMAHILGAKDLYMNNPASWAAGPYSDIGQSMSLMVAPWTGLVPHLDPWHKIKLGWESVQSFRLNEPGSCYSLVDQSVDWTGGSGVLVLWDPDRGPNEYFILEHRNPSTSIYDTGINTVLGVPGSGLAVWNVVGDGSGGIVPVPAIIYDPGPSLGGNGALETEVIDDDVIDGSDGSIRSGPDHFLDSTIPPGSDDVLITARWVFLYGAGAQSVGKGAPWQASDGIFRLTWSDGVDAGIEMQVAPNGDRLLDVAWARGGLGSGALASHPTDRTAHPRNRSVVDCYERVVD